MPGAMMRPTLLLVDAAQRVTRAGEEVALSPTECNLQRFLMGNAGRAVSKGRILDDVWSLDFASEPAVVETYVGSLRRKVDQAEPKLIHTIRPVGCTLRAPAPFGRCDPAADAMSREVVDVS